MDSSHQPIVRLAAVMPSRFATRPHGIVTIEPRALLASRVVPGMPGFVPDVSQPTIFRGFSQEQSEVFFVPPQPEGKPFAIYLLGGAPTMPMAGAPIQVHKQHFW